MVSDFIQKNVIILRILLIITMMMYYISSTLHATDVKVLLKNDNLYTASHDMPAVVWNGLQHQGFGRKKMTRIVIDAGHGGHDSGAVGKNSYEKDLTLKMALKVGDMIQKKYPDVEVLQTRTTDVFIPLFRRIQYANEQNADLFISIHCNFISNPKTRGTETFVMGLHRAGDNLGVAKRENASILLEQNYEANYDGYDPNSPEGHIMLSMYQNAYLDKSIEFAADVEEQFSNLLLSKSRGVKQAGFAVLRRASMPAVLVEAGFLSNDVEEAYLMSDDGQNAVCQSLLKAFDTFYNNNLTSRQYVTTDNPQSPADKNDIEANVKKQIEKVKASGGSSGDKSQKNISSPSINVEYNAIKYRVQIAAVKNETTDMNTSELRKIGTLIVKKQNDVNKYLVGDYISRESAEIAREKLKNLGYKGAFIIPCNE